MLKNFLPGLVGIIVSQAAIVASTIPAAAIVYSFDRTLGTGVSVSGVIETDGFIGAIDTANVTDWDIDVTFVLSPALSVSVNLLTSNSAIDNSDFQGNFTATASQLLWNFNGSGSFLIVGNNKENFWGLCGDPSLSFCSVANAEHASASNPFGTTALASNASNGTGSFVAAEAAVPEPATLGLFGLGLAGLGLASRQRRTHRPESPEPI